MVVVSDELCDLLPVSWQSEQMDIVRLDTQLVDGVVDGQGSIFDHVGKIVHALVCAGLQ